MRAVRPEDVNIYGAKRLLLSLRVSAGPGVLRQNRGPPSTPRAARLAPPLRVHGTVFLVDVAQLVRFVEDDQIPAAARYHLIRFQNGKLAGCDETLPS